MEINKGGKLVINLIFIKNFKNLNNYVNFKIRKNTQESSFAPNI